MYKLNLRIKQYKQYVILIFLCTETLKNFGGWFLGSVPLFPFFYLHISSSKWYGMGGGEMKMYVTWLEGYLQHQMYLQPATNSAWITYY